MYPHIAFIEPQTSTPHRKHVAGSFLKTILTGVLLATAMGSPVLAQTIKNVDDGTVLKQIIIFGRHSIRGTLSSSNTLGQYSVQPYPDFVGVPVGYLTTNGQKAAGLFGSYFHDYLLHEGLLTGNTNTDLARSYFRANTIQRSYMTAAKFGAGLIPGITIPVHSYPAGTPDEVFDPLAAGVAIVDPVRAATEIQGVYGTGSTIASAYTSELSLIRNVLYPPGTQPTNNASQGSIDPTTLPFALSNSAPQLPPKPPYFAGNVIATGGLNATLSAADPFVMQYVNGFPTNDVGWGRLNLDTLSQQTRLITLQIDISMRQPYLARVQSSSAASHVLRSMDQAISGAPLAGAFGDPQSQILVIVSSDYYVAGLAGLLDLHWMLPGYQRDFCTLGGALVFELRQVIMTGEYFVRAFYTAQTFDQLRSLTPLTLDAPPATMQLFIPGASHAATNLDVSFVTFSNLLSQAIGLEYVRPFADEVPPGVLNPYIANNPTNLTASLSSKKLTITWPVDHLGWILQAQTNGLNTGPWLDLPGSDQGNSLVTPTDYPSAFYRLSRP